MDRNEQIGVIHKNPLDSLVVAVKSYKGREYVDIRQYFTSDAGEVLPTKRGITVSPALWTEFLELLNKVAPQLGDVEM